MKKESSMENAVTLFLNGRKVELEPPRAFLTLSTLLREERGLTGTKVVCAEGDCGACTVLLGRFHQGTMRYRAVNSCILFAFQCHGAHVVTVEGVTPKEGLNPVQQAMVDHHGSQCGYCTPGFVMALMGMLEKRLEKEDTSPFTEEELRRGLSGNLCRCTGYGGILDAARAIDPKRYEPLENRYPPAGMEPKLKALSGKSVCLSGQAGAAFDGVMLPKNLDEALQWKAKHPDAQCLQGATDLGVRHNKGLPLCREILYLGDLEELKTLEEQEGFWKIGAACSWTESVAFLRDCLPVFSEMLDRFGSPLIRNAGTIGGNIMNASPIADSLPALLVLETELVAASKTGERRLPLTDFYMDYKKTRLAPDEILKTIWIPAPPENGWLDLEKVSRRRDLDIATFTAAWLLQLEGDTIHEARLALGGVAPTARRLPRTEAFLQGKICNPETLEQAGKIALEEVAPISDVRGEKSFREDLTRTIWEKFRRIRRDR